MCSSMHQIWPNQQRYKLNIKAGRNKETECTAGDKW